MIDYKLLKEKIELLDTGTVVLIAGHKNADYDSITSCIALAHILTKLGYTAYALLEEKDMDKTHWLNTSLVINKYLAEKPFNFIMLDANRKERLGTFEVLFDKATISICIDHHEDNHNEATYSFVDENISSTAEIIANLANEYTDILDEEISTLLYAGIASDTNSFYKRTTPATMATASNLLSHGAKGSFAIKNACKNMTLSEAAILSNMLANITYDTLHYIVLDRKDDLYSNVPYSTIFKKCASYVYELSDISIFALLLIEHDGSVSGLLRSNSDVDVDELAKSLGGGGHKKAAGFETNMPIETVLDAVKKYVEAKITR